MTSSGTRGDAGSMVSTTATRWAEGDAGTTITVLPRIVAPGGGVSGRIGSTAVAVAVASGSMVAIGASVGVATTVGTMVGPGVAVTGGVAVADMVAIVAVVGEAVAVCAMVMGCRSAGGRQIGRAWW